MKQVAIIGMGNIGSILAKRLCLAVPPEQVAIFDRHPETMETVVQQVGCVSADSAQDAARGARYVILAVKPKDFSALLKSLLPVLDPEQCLVSTAAGIELNSIQQLLESSGAPALPVVRIMPNLPISIGKGCILVSKNEQFSLKQEEGLVQLLSQCGMCQNVDEEHFGMGVSLSSCTPAYVFMFLEALADGGIALGYSRKESELISAEAVRGAVDLFLESGKSLGYLKDAVCSPKGAAITGVLELERAHFRGAIISAVEEAYKKNESMKFELR
ncbi:pyrroline-5-carboxylate reductase [Oscillibacter sp.]|uniref:pyrroline-5-carboxylate reductase n=1 Tax=Oscillibacter sp. TaxID=1945593 RepID=UPI0028AF957C|nr:pyrroline-5-carboxylate reductase [Oscillibacter sp.]